MFIDQAVIQVRSGKGGDGAVHFRREKYVPFGGPDGGDGGRGGDVIIRVAPKLNTLSRFRQQTKFHAQEGGRGAKQNMTGRSAEAVVILVPPGTLVYSDDSGELLGDLVAGGQELVVARGGRGGRGNARFATARNQAPRIGEKGEPGEEKRLRLELKLIADIGIVGVPNAGKSTFLAAVTNARPKIAAYPFTTLEPNLGVADLDAETSLVLADIPGLIEGAHRGLGLGYEFLRHIQRTRVLIHVLDGMAEDPVLDYIQINSELALFDENLAAKPQVVAINKIDIAEVKERLASLTQRLKLEAEVDNAFPVSALTRENLKEVLYRAASLLHSLPPEPIPETVPVYRVESDPREFAITHLTDGWRVESAALIRAAAMTYWEYPQSVRRFQRILEKLGVDKALREAGIQNGDMVFIGDYELEWSD
ncbi:MAG: GTPase ObgE [Anaerolineales bacterium]|nr:GTPase ObgE [Anaerolineales bacterium]